MADFLSGLVFHSSYISLLSHITKLDILDGVDKEVKLYLLTKPGALLWALPFPCKMSIAADSCPGFDQWCVNTPINLLSYKVGTEALKSNSRN